MKLTQAIRLTDRQKATLRKAREALGLTPAQLGDRVGVTRSMIAMIESGKKPAPALLLSRLASELGLVFSAKITAELRPKKTSKKT